MRYVLGRLAHLLVILAVVTFFVSAMVSLMPGDPALAVLGDAATPDQIHAFHQQFHLDEPIVARYGTWLKDAAQGNLGESLRGGVPMVDLIWQRAPVSLELLIGGQVLALLFAIPAGIYAAYRPGRAGDQTLGVLSFGLISTPSFVLALVLVLVFALRLHWLPVAGYVPFTGDPVRNLQAMIMPMVVVAAHPAAVYQRVLRNDMRATLQEDFILMAEAKGQSTARVLLRHALRPSLFSLVTLVGVTTGSAIAGTVIVETIFALPGLGRLLYDSISFHDIAAIQAIVAVIAIAYVVVNALVDVLYGLLDPRVRHAR